MDAEELRLAVYSAFADGRTPTVAALAAATGVPEAEVRDGLAALAAQRHLALRADGEIAMAHPFTAVPLGFSVMGRNRLWWGGCAWDSFAVPHLLPHQAPVLVATTCPACARPHAWSVGTDAPPPGDQVAHFLVPAARMWDDVVHTCDHQRLFCSESCVDAWLVRRPAVSRVRPPGAERGRRLPARGRAVGLVLGVVAPPGSGSPPIPAAKPR